MTAFSHLNQFGSLIRYCEDMIAHPGSNDYLPSAAVREGHQSFLRMLLAAQRFIVPDIGNLFIGDRITYQEKHLDLVRLPFDTIAVLYVQEQKISERIERLSVVTIYTNHTERWSWSERSFSCFTALRLAGGWHLDPVALLIDPSEFQVGVGLLAHGFPSMPSRQLATELEHNFDAYLEDGLEQRKVAVIVDLCCALACSNIHQTTIAPSDHRLARRARAGKAPLFSYKILEVEQDTSVNGGGYQVGERNSPRTHLRRGHIRRLHDGRIVWVQACVVRGETPGIVIKDYQINPRDERPDA